MSYRAYPAPPNTTLHGRPNGHDRNHKNDGPLATSRPTNFSGTSSKDPSRPRVPGLSNPVLSPTKTTAPEAKRRRAVPNSQPFRSTTDEFTKMADEGIAKRRAELRSLQSGRSSTADLLARAMAVTSGRGSAAVVAPRSFSSHGSHAPPKNDFNGNPYPTRTRPILPKSPPRQRPTFEVPRQRKPLVASDNVPNIERNKNIGIAPKPAAAFNDAANPPPASVPTVKTDERSLGKTDSISPKSQSPNQKVNVLASFVPSSEMAGIKPITAINKQVEANKRLMKNDPPPVDSDETKNRINHSEANHLNDSGDVEPPNKDDNAAEKEKVSGPILETKDIGSVVSLASTTAVVDDHKAVQEEKKVESIPPPPLTNEPSKRRETMEFLRNAALSPSVPDKKKNLKQEQVAKTGGVDQAVKNVVIEQAAENDGNQKLMQKTNGVQIDEKEEIKKKTFEESSQSKIMKELLEAKQLREKALKQVAQLEKEVLELRLERERNDYHLQERMVHKERSRSLSRSSRRKRMKSPQPTNRNKTDASSNPLSDNDIACRAVETVEDVYSSDLATYAVRKPYGGNETMEYAFPVKSGENMSSCKVSWHQPVEIYLKTAKIQEEASIEVISKVEADNSILLLHGSSCRHGIAVVGSEGSIIGYEWKSYDDIEKMDGSLGRIIYIDVNGNDGEYWLDSIYEEALKIRENYCSNVYSAALALRVSSPKTPNFGNHFLEDKSDQNQLRGNVSPIDDISSPSVMNSESHHRNRHDEEPKLQREGTPEKQYPAKKAAPIMVDACVGTDKLPALKVPEENKPKPKIIQEPSRTQESNQVEIESGSTDALSAFVIFFFGTIFSIVWFVICIPFRVMKWTSLASILYIFISITWLYFANDNGAMSLGAGIDYHLNSPGVH